MVVSISGSVGSGKSTVAQQAADLLRQRGYIVSVLRFQGLPCFTLFRTALRPPTRIVTPPEDGEGSRARAVRWSQYKLKRLGVVAAAVYLARIVTFRIYRARRWKRDQVYVLNRYFYDLFAHYRLESNTERFWLRLLRAAMPTPDLAIVVLADADALAARRPDYAAEYLAASSAAYSRLRHDFPNVIELRNDAGVAELMARLGQLLPMR
jgi:thymidylate kinase